MTKSIFIFALAISFILFSHLASATMTCTDCQVNNCVCQITDCVNGGVRGWSGSSCSGLMSYQYVFSGSSLTWFPPSSGTYGFRVDCPGVTSDCIPISVKPVTTTTTTNAQTTTSTTTTNSTTTTTKKTTTTTTETETSTETTSEIETTSETETTTDTEVQTGGPSIDYSLILIVIVLIVVSSIIFFIYYRRKQTGWQDLYSKWGRGR